MNELLDALRTYIILSMQDLTRIKTSLSRQYAHLTDLERAEMLSMAVHNLLDKHLAGIDATYLQTIKVQILTDTLAKHVYEITRYDIFESIFKQELSNETKLILAESWLAESARILVPTWALEEYLNNGIVPLKKATPLSVDPSSVKRVVIAFKWRISYEAFNRFLSRVFPKLVIVLASFFAIVFAARFFVNVNEKPPTIINLIAQQDYSTYQGMSALDRVYLIDRISGFTNENAVTLNLQKQTLPYGIQTQISHFHYKSFDYFTVKHYIAGARNGLIGLPEHFNRVLHIAYLNNIDPLLLLAIIGQEQAFVKMDSDLSNRIINNPYNVYHSWSEYNTSLRDSTQIAINTIVNRLSTAPLDESPFRWLNTVYAEDPNWHNGVRLIYGHLVDIGRGE